MAAEEDEAGEVGGEAHVAESTVGEGELICAGDAGLVGVVVGATVLAGAGVDVGGGAGGLGSRMVGGKEGVADQFGGETQADGLDEGETGDGRRFEGVPGVAEPAKGERAADDAGFLGGAGTGQALADAVFGGEEDGALGIAVLIAERYVLDGHAEEAGEAESLNAGCGVFEGATEDFGTDVNAENGLDSGAGGFDWERSGFLKAVDESALVGELAGELPDVLAGEVLGGGTGGGGGE